MAEIRTRLYTAGDQDGVIWLYQRTPPAGRTYVTPAESPDDLRSIPESFAAFWVACEETPDGEAIVGIAGAEHVAGRDSELDLPIPDFIAIDRRLVRAHHVMVVPERQRRGIGRALMVAMVTWAQESGYEAVFLNTTTEQVAAVAFYKGLGFSEVGRTTFQRWELVWLAYSL